LGRVTKYEYDANENIIKIIRDYGGPLHSETVSNYDNAGNRTRMIDPLGNITQYDYDGYGNLIRITDPLGNISTFTYDIKGNKLTETDANGNTTAYTYDVMDRMVSMTDPLGNSTTYSYDANGNIISKTDPEGNINTYSYDAYNRLIRETDPLGNMTTHTYDANGNRTSITDANGNTTTYINDSVNRVIQETNPLGGLIKYTYDPVGHLSSRTDENGNTTLYAYDGLGRLVSVTDSMGGITAHQYDAASNLLSVTDANGNATTYQYDSMNRMVRTVSSDAGMTSYTYDLNANVITRTEAKGITVNYHYDSINRLLTTEFPDAAQNVTYTYDGCINGKGSLCSMTDPSGTQSYAYNTRGLVTKVVRLIDGVPYITENSYSPNGSLKQLVYPSGAMVTYTYTANRITRVEHTINGFTRTIASDISYTPTAMTSQIIYGNGLTTDMSYNARNQISSLKIGALKQLSYTRDNVGNINSINDQLNPLSDKTFTYDALYRLAKATGPWGNLEYSYDPVGNRIVEDTDSGTTNYSYSGNRLISTTGAKNFVFDYDENGNTISENLRQYNYNQNKRLTSVVENSNVLGDYVYNGIAQRVKKVAGGKTTLFHYDLQGLLIAESDPTGIITSEYVYLYNQPLAKVELFNYLETCLGDLNRSGEVNVEDLSIYAAHFGIAECTIDESCLGDLDGDIDIDGRDLAAIIEEFGNTNCPYELIYFYTNDHLGTPILMTDNEGLPIFEGEFLPFGEIYSITGSAINNFRFPGQFYDNETGLSYNHFRYYQSKFSRYNRPDPASIRNGMNLYIYAKNNPLQYIDPYGLYVICVGGAGGWAVGLGGPAAGETGSMVVCFDHNFNFAAVECSGPFLGWGAGFLAGMNIKITVGNPYYNYSGPVTLCDIFGDSSGVGGGYAKGVGQAASGSFSNGSITIEHTVGIGLGGWGGGWTGGTCEPVEPVECPEICGRDRA
jgi:RHS repeat-associated protein